MPPNAPPPAGSPPPPPNSVATAPIVDDVNKTSTGDKLGGQVTPETMRNEANGNRTLLNPKRDPGPAVREGGINVVHPDRAKGEHRYSDANEPVPVNMRVSTGHDEGYGKPGGDVVQSRDMAPDIAASGAASDVYNKEDVAPIGSRVDNTVPDNAATSENVISKE